MEIEPSRIPNIYNIYQEYKQLYLYFNSYPEDTLISIETIINQVIPQTTPLALNNLTSLLSQFESKTNKLIEKISLLASENPELAKTYKANCAQTCNTLQDRI